MARVTLTRNDILYFYKTHKEAIKPQRGTAGSAGFDLYSLTSIHLAPWSTVNTDTGIAVKIPTGCYGRIAARSGLASEQSLTILGGVIDCDYVGSIFVILKNLSDQHIYLPAKTRIAQLILEKFQQNIKLEELENYSMLGETDRGSNGLGEASGIL